MIDLKIQIFNLCIRINVLLLDIILYFKVHYNKAIISFVLCFGLVGCENLQNKSVSKIFVEKQIVTSDKNQSLMRKRFDKESLRAATSATPSLSSVPLRPKNITSHANRKKILNQLYRDRRNAKNNDDFIKNQEK